MKVSCELVFLGAGDSQGVPRWWCDCAVCQEARATGRNRRTRPSLLLRESLGGTLRHTLIDAAPELRLQLVREGVRTLEAAIITHAHNDHIMGLGDLADMVRWTGRRLPIYAPAEVIPELQARFPYLAASRYAEHLAFRPLEQAALTVAGYRVQAYRVPHGFNGFAYGLRFDGAQHSFAYIPDSLDLVALEPWQGLELLILGTSFYHEPAPKAQRSIYSVREAQSLVARLRPARTVFTHLGHGVDVRQAAPPGTRYACDGLVLPL